MVPLVEKALAGLDPKRFREAQRRLRELENLFPLSKVFEPVRKKLKEPAEYLLRQAQDLKTGGIMIGGIVALLAAAAAVAWLLIAVLRMLPQRGYSWRYGLANLRRRPLAEQQHDRRDLTGRGFHRCILGRCQRRADRLRNFGQLIRLELLPRSGLPLSRLGLVALLLSLSLARRRLFHRLALGLVPTQHA